MIFKTMTFKKTTTIALAACALTSAAFAQQQAQPKTVAGKVVAVSHEKVQVNNQWLDQIKVKVESCAKQGALEEVVYSSATVSDRAVLGQLFDGTFHQARAMTMDAPQRQVNGYGLFWVDAANKVQRTGVLGADMDCAQVPKLIQQFQ